MLIFLDISTAQDKDTTLALHIGDRHTITVLCQENGSSARHEAGSRSSTLNLHKLEFEGL